MTSDHDWYKPTSVTIHPDTVTEIDELRDLFGTSKQDVMREAISRAGQEGVALTVPDRSLSKRGEDAMREKRMLYMRRQEHEALWRVQRALDLNASRAIEVCIHNAWLACMVK